MGYHHQLVVHNNLSGQKEPFTPIDSSKVRIYVCGMTVYDLCHIGHARVLVVFDVLVRYLRFIYGTDAVHYVRNVTDIDDKIIQRANQNSEPFQQLTSRFIAEMHADSAALGVLPPDEEPHATAYMDQIITMIQKLIDNGYGYAAANGDVYYDVSRFQGYGKLSGKDPDDLRAGERVAIDEFKQDPLDFVLWKAAKANEPSWPSPWGDGRPGWHIECSAMSTHCLGDHFDIHGGGLDLQFPHHENEIAQSEGATGCHFVNYWLHNGFVRIDNEKMSKSLGNFFTIREVLQQYDAEVIRYFILNSHYRSPLNYSDVHLDGAKSALTTLYTALRNLDATATPMDSLQGEHCNRFWQALDDDVNTPEALSVLFELAHAVNRSRDSNMESAKKLGGDLLAMAGMLGLLQQQPEQFLRGRSDDAEAAKIEALIVDRNQARADKNWSRADEVRAELTAMGVVVEDGANGTTWRKG